MTGCRTYGGHGESMAVFASTAKVAGRPLTDLIGTDELSQAEGARHLVRMIRAGFESSCELADLRHPRIVPMIEPTMLYEGVTPDARAARGVGRGHGRNRARGPSALWSGVSDSVAIARRARTRPSRRGAGVPE